MKTERRPIFIIFTGPDVAKVSGGSLDVKVRRMDAEDAQSFQTRIQNAVRALRPHASVVTITHDEFLRIIAELEERI